MLIFQGELIMIKKTNQQQTRKWHEGPLGIKFASKIDHMIKRDNVKL